MGNTNFQTIHQMGTAISNMVKQATGRDDVQNIDMEHITVAQNHSYEEIDLSGQVVSFIAGEAGLPFEKLDAQIKPVQNLHGYDAPWPGGGNTNKFQTTAETKTENGVTWTVNTDGSITVSGTATGYTILYAGKADVSGMTGNVTVGFNFTETTNIAWASSYLLDDDNNQLYTITSGSGNIPSFTVDLTDYPTAKWITATFKRNNNVATSGTIKVQAVSGSSMLTWVPYSNICPITGWTMVNVYQAGENMEDARVYRVTFPSEAGIVYGGTLDVVSGELVVNMANIASYNGETLPGEWISDRDVYAEGTTPTTGAQVVYQLATPIIYHLTPQEITTLLGQNYIWADTGDIEVKFTNIKEMY